MDYTYGIYLYDNAAALDFAGPYEVFNVSTHFRKAGRVFTIAAEDRPVKCNGGLTVVPDHTFETAPVPDVLLVPGAESLEAALAEKGAIEWIRSLDGRSRFITAVCTGALILQKAGLLKGRKATTHHMLTETLAEDPEVTVLPEMRYVRDGHIVTSQGVSAGIDMALWLVGQLHTPDHAREVRKLLQYDPAPPYTAEV